MLLCKVQTGPGSLRIGIILMFFLPNEGFSSCRGGSEFLGRYEILLPSVYCEKVSDQFPGYGKCGPIRIPLDLVPSRRYQLTHG